MQHVDELLDLLHLDAAGADHYVGQHPETLMQRTFGGQVMAQALAAVYETVDAARVAHSLKGYFLRPGSTDAPIDYFVERTRDGGTFSTRRIQAVQRGKEIFLMTASLKVPEEGLEHTERPAVEPLPPDECPPLAQVLGERSRRAAEMWEREWAAVEARFVPTQPVARGGARMQAWIRSHGDLPDDPRVHQMVLAYASDLTLLGVTTVPHPYTFGQPQLQMATVDHSMWFHRPLRADQWVLYDQSSPNAANGLGFATGRLYDEQGVLGASTSQEGLIRIVGS
ncbi:acyl-CoA thioesterase II [Propioniciclava sp.]|uniref:acyl-CoA thioesterase n=1 Tax=Propioniciclava sp. TaxID=2038686 RepID=UPI0026030C20|nr:acyl-CoA thioesterase II [Propioniciclava sp.]